MLVTHINGTSMHGGGGANHISIPEVAFENLATRYVIATIEQE